MGSQQGAGEEQLSACRAREPCPQAQARLPRGAAATHRPWYGPSFANSSGQRTLPSRTRFLETNWAVLSVNVSVILSYVVFY